MPSIRAININQTRFRHFSYVGGGGLRLRFSIESEPQSIEKPRTVQYESTNHLNEPKIFLLSFTHQFCICVLQVIRLLLINCFLDHK